VGQVGARGDGEVDEFDVCLPYLPTWFNVDVLRAVVLGVFDVRVEGGADTLTNGRIVSHDCVDVPAAAKVEKALGAVAAACMPRYCSTGARGVASRCWLSFASKSSTSLWCQTCCRR